ncbi:hypothetical protein FIBSPDRAFT_1038407 [Athelia psychrophila]|uniref:Glycoside hydrolase family 39 protein n=1 Tax=Athelia psychrophila TaxID=1759441 RepID=A0A166T0D1_9AGAM|nr:hypothetical protein FIBSPDRAFT_1038407 [Fibularhizoctonia sp. CBS 109695]
MQLSCQYGLSVALLSLASSRLSWAKEVGSLAHRQSSSANISVDWSNVLLTSKTTTTLQVVVNPLLLDNSSVAANVWQSLNSVSADYVRFVPWFLYPKLFVPEIDAPVNNASGCFTGWDFSYADQFVKGFFSSTPNKSHIINFSTTPDWMWSITEADYSYPADINASDLAYNNGTQLRDSSFQEVSDYYSRLVSWYVNGSFTDECGVNHTSGHHYDIEYWEVLNEIGAEHNIQPEYYNQIYDAVTAAIHAISPPTNYFKTFLDPAKHAANTPLDFASYHFYGSPDNDTTQNEAAQSFAQADVFLADVSQVDAIRQALSPATRYWIWSGGIYAYIFAKAAVMGIDAVGESQLVGCPTQYPSVSMVDWTTGLPNARLKVLQLLLQSFAAGDAVVQTDSSDDGAVHGQAFVSPTRGQKVLLVNKLEPAVEVRIAGFDGGVAETVDVGTQGAVWRTESIAGSTFNLTGYATAVLTTKGR